MKILITGIHGFVGSNLVRALENYHQIYGLDIIAPEKPGVIKTFSWEDLNQDIIPNVDAIIHLAGKAHDTKNKSAADVYFKVNTDLTKKIFDYFSNHPEIKKFIFFSSVKAAVDKVPGDILTEDVEPCPVGPYGESKVRAENYILNVLDKNPNNFSNKDVVILRPCMIHGPGNKGNLNLLYAVISKGIPCPFGAFDNRRTFTSVGNLIYVIKRILEMPIKSGIYNMADDDALSINQLIDIIYSTLGKKSKILSVNRNLIKLSAKIGDILHLPINTFRLTKLTENYVVSNKKIKQALLIENMPVSSRDGLIATIKSFEKDTRK